MNEGDRQNGNDEPTRGSDAADATRLRRRDRYSVLVVDDEHAFLETTAAILEPRCEVRTMRTATHALRLLEDRATPCRVVVTDWQMPDMNGIEFYRAVCALDRSVGCLLVTGHLEALLDEVAWCDRRTLATMRKPCDPHELVSRVEHLARLSGLKESSARLRDVTTQLADALDK